MGDAACSNIRKQLPNISSFELDNLINAWDNAQSAFENLQNTVWTFDNLIYGENGLTDFKKIKSETNFNKYDKLQILSDRVIFSNLTTGFRDTTVSSGSSNCSPGYIFLKYKLNDNDQTEFLDNTREHLSEFKVALIKNTEDTPQSATELWIKVTVDPIVNSDSNYRKIDSLVEGYDKLRTSDSQPIQGLKLKFELNFRLRDCAPTTNKLSSTNNKISYWNRINIRNACAIPNSLLSNHAVLAKCIKYKAGKFSDNIKDLYHNMIVTGAKAKNQIRNDIFNGDDSSLSNNQKCPARNTQAFNICNNTNPENIRETNLQCATALNCEWSGENSSISDALGNKDDDSCPGRGNACLLNTLETAKNTIKNLRKSLELYYAYPQHRNPFNTTVISQFGNDCNADTITEIESLCSDKNIGISFRFEPVSCTPGHPEFNQATCNSNCGSNDQCKTPVLVSEPDLSAFKCTLEGLDQLEKYCSDINDQLIGNSNYENLGITENQRKLPGYNKANWPNTGCNEAMVESHLMYIRSLLMSKLQSINNQINDIIKDDAIRVNEFAKNKMRRLEVLNISIQDSTDQIQRINQNVLATATEIGIINEEYTQIRGNITEFNKSLDLRFERKKREFKFTIFFSIFIINILFFLIFFRKK